MRLLAYRIALEEAGIEPPDGTGEEMLTMWRDAAAVISAASEFVHDLGTSRELLDDSWFNGRKDNWKRAYARPA